MNNRASAEQTSLKMSLRTLSRHMSNQAYSISEDHLAALVSELAEDPTMVSLLLGAVANQASLLAGEAVRPADQAIYEATCQAGRLAQAVYDGSTYQSRQTVRRLTKETVG